MAFDADYLDGAFTDTLLGAMGESVTYTPVGVAGSTITAIFQPQIGALDVQATATFFVSSDDVASPNPGDTITRSGEVWVVLDFRTETSVHDLRCAAPQERV